MGMGVPIITAIRSFIFYHHHQHRRRRYHWPCDFEHTQKSGAAQDADAERVHDVGLDQNYFDDTENDDEWIEPVEHGIEIFDQP